MKKSLKSLAAYTLLAILLSFTEARAYFAETNYSIASFPNTAWTLINKNANGSLVQKNSTSPLSGNFTLIGGDNGSHLAGTTTYQKTFSKNYKVQFNWVFTTKDEATFWDPAGYVVNGSKNQLSVGNPFHSFTTNAQSGSLILQLAAGQTFGWYVYTLDNEGGAASLAVSFAPANYEQFALNQNQTNVAIALDTFLHATSGDKAVVAGIINNLDFSQFSAAFNAIMPTIYQSLSTTAFNLANAQNQELIQRLWGLRISGGGFSMSGLSDNTPVIEGQGDGGKSVVDAKKDILRPGLDNHWGMFVDGNGIFAQATSASMLPTYNSQSGGVTTGLTYKWNENFGTGIYAGYEGSYNKYSGGSTIIDNSVRFGLFGTYGQKNTKGEAVGFYSDALIGGGYNNYQVTRNINFPGLSRTANSSPGAGELDSLLSGGYDLKHGNWTYGPTTSLQYTYFGANPVNETGAQSLDFNSGGWNTSSLLYSLGGHVAYTWTANKDITVVPQISLSWQHEFMQNPYDISGSLGGSPSFNNTSSAPLRDTLYTGVGFTAEFYKKWNTSLFYNASAGNQNLVSQNIFWSAGVKF